MLNKNRIDTWLLINVILLALFGIFAFLSASLGILARESVQYSSIILNQIFLGLICGSISAYIVSQIPYMFWRKYSFWIFAISIIITLLVFTPLGLDLKGAKRWISIGTLSFQPSELLKIGYILYLATWIYAVKDRIKTFKYGILPFLIISGITTLILAFQPDNDTAFIILISGLSMLFIAGAKIKHLLITILIVLAFASPILLSRDYVVERVKNFLNIGGTSEHSNYQIEQSLIAIGSGGLTGRGFGQSIQKFNFLPEPIGDSIFSVISEEFGFIGSIILVILYIMFLIRSIKLSTLVPDNFGGLVMVGIAILIVSQSFLNIASMIKLFPLSGLPLLFVSHGGTALFFTLTAVGIMFNISRFKKKI